MEEKGGGENEILRTAVGGGNGAPMAMRFSVPGGNGAPLRSAGGVGNKAPRTMGECEGFNKGGNGVTTPRRTPFINPR